MKYNTLRKKVHIHELIIKQSKCVSGAHMKRTVVTKSALQRDCMTHKNKNTAI